jgi:LuxR family maltose regulon positive regulatory protein
VARLHAVSARWWADQDRPLRALEHAAQSGDDALLTDLLQRFAVRLILAGDHGLLRRAMASVDAQAMVADPGLSLASALTHLAAGELAAAQRDLRHAQQSWPVHGAGEHAEVPARGGERPHLRT